MTNKTPEEREEEELCRMVDEEMTLFADRYKRNMIMAHRLGLIEKKRKKKEWQNSIEEGR